MAALRGVEREREGEPSFGPVAASAACGNAPSFIQLFLCLSRASLGKCSVFS
eukprot:COSAG06_NODE_100_length_24132_cov_93.237507_22_plen_51_part_01